MNDTYFNPLKQSWPQQIELQGGESIFYNSFQADYKEPNAQVQYDRNYLAESGKSDDCKYFYTVFSVFSIMYDLLNFENDEVLKIGSKIIWECINQEKKDIQISRTGENELLIFRNVRGTFNNIIIDGDCDIEFMSIPPDRSSAYNIYYPLDESPKIETLVNNL